MSCSDGKVWCGLSPAIPGQSISRPKVSFSFAYNTKLRSKSRCEILPIAPAAHHHWQPFPRRGAPVTPVLYVLTKDAPRAGHQRALSQMVWDDVIDNVHEQHIAIPKC